MADRQVRDIFEKEIFDELGVKVVYSGDPTAPVAGDRKLDIVTSNIYQYNGSTWEFKGTGAEFITVTPTGDDKGLNVNAELSVGSPAQGYETVLGEGDSYGVPIAYHCDIANTTGNIITSATDVATILQSDTGSTTGLFGGTDAGKYIFVGSDYKYGGVKLKVDTAGNIEPANIIGEYLESVGSWVTAPFMSTNANFPYNQTGHHIAVAVGSEQIRFGFNPLALPVSWVKCDMVVNGTTLNKYWARFRVTSAITLDAVIQQLKLHTNRFEVNAEGVTEYFGRSRYQVTIIKTLSEWSNTSTSPSNDPVKYSNNITLTLIDNEFANNTIDAIGVAFKVPVGLDTSIPLQIDLNWFPKSTSSDNVNWKLYNTTAEIGDTLDASKADTLQNSTASAGTDEVLKKSTFLVMINDANPGDTIALKLERDSTSGEALDTYGGNVVLESAQVIGYFWRP